MNILSIGASSSSTSINQQLADHTASQVSNAQVTRFSIRDLSLPVYSEDEEKENGIPADAHSFLEAIRAHDGIVISLAEHNGSYTAAFKNLFDWTSRIDQKLWSDTPMLLLSTSPGPRGGATVLAAAEGTFPHLGGNIISSLSFPSFYDNFSDKGISDAALTSKLESAVGDFSSAIA